MKSIIFSIAALAVFSGCIKDRIQATVVPPVVTGDTLMYYWSFNTQDTSIHTPDYYVNPGATFEYSAAYIDFTDGSILNLQHGADSGSSLRVRNPSSYIVFKLPTTGYDSVTFSFAERRSNSGSSLNTILYTVDGINYINTAIGQNSYQVDTLYNAYKFTLAADAAINNNSKFAVKIIFSNNNTGTSGNDRFDNVALKGKKR